MDHFKYIYANQADLYEKMVSREDQRGNIFSALNEIHPLHGMDVVEFGSGTGRLTRMLSVMVNRISAFDIAPAMLNEAHESLQITGMTNWALGVADNRQMPIANQSADVVIEGWSFAHTVGWSPDNWQDEINKMLAEMRRILRPRGTAILLETMGTGNKQPQPPNEGLAELYQWWEREHGFQYQWIRTDYQFESVEEADRLTRFFFGDALADRIVDEQMTILPECTGIWWRRFD